jgi:hypothetical protein
LKDEVKRVLEEADTRTYELEKENKDLKVIHNFIFFLNRTFIKSVSEAS